jgi:hypothetical protein
LSFAFFASSQAKYFTVISVGIGFEDVVIHIERGDLLDILEHPNPDRYAGQRILVVQRGGLRVPGAFR